MPTLSITQKTKLVQGVYPISETKALISSMLDAQINFHKEEFLRHWEADHSVSATFRDQRIKALTDQKQKLTDFIAHVQEAGDQLHIEGLIELKMIENENA